MKKLRITACLLAMAVIFSVSGGCSDDNKVQSSSTSTSVGEKTNVDNNEDVNANEINVSVAEEANKNETGFILNSVIDSGERNEENQKYIYFNVTIKNTSDEDYELNTLNNFYILKPDGTEVHFDIRTQLFAQKNYKNYVPNPIKVPAKGEFTGYIGGYAVDESVNDFTVCFFPTQNDARNKSDVIKCPVTASDIISPPADFIG